MNKSIAVTFMWIASWVVLICVMIYGWGLEPKSWSWIIGGGIFGRMAVEIINLVTKN